MTPTDKLAGISPYVVNAVTDWLLDHEGMQRPPEQAAKILVFIRELHRLHLPFPKRDDVAAHLGVSKSSVDAVINHRRRTQDIIEVAEFTEGHVGYRPSSRRQRFIMPSPELANIIDKAKREEARIKRTGMWEPSIE